MNNKMDNKIVITVIGADKIGIVACVAAKVTSLNMNILDISQKILDNNIFSMFMLVEDQKNNDIQFLQEEFKSLGKQIGVKIFLQHEDIFKSMHRI